MAFTTRISWHGEEFKGKLRKEMELRLATAGEMLAGRARKLISKPYPPASEKGNPPHTRRYQQGLLGSVFSELHSDDLTCVVGTTMIHGLYLELGPLDRKWLGPALDQMQSTIQRILTAPMPEGATGGESEGDSEGEGESE
jgi:hypothetical protein